MSEGQKFDYYEVLGVSPSASKQTIVSAYRKMALKVHPDRNPDKKSAILFLRIKEALDILNDDKARVAYDAVIRAKQLRKKRDRDMDDKRREMMDTLLQREQAYKKQKADEEVAKNNYKAEVTRVRKEARKRRKAEEAEKEKERERELQMKQQQTQQQPQTKTVNKSTPFSFLSSSVTPAGSHEDLEEKVLKALHEAAAKQSATAGSASSFPSFPSFTSFPSFSSTPESTQN